MVYSGWDWINPCFKQFHVDMRAVNIRLLFSKTYEIDFYMLKDCEFISNLLVRMPSRLKFYVFAAW